MFRLMGMISLLLMLFVTSTNAALPTIHTIRWRKVNFGLVTIAHYDVPLTISDEPRPLIILFTCEFLGLGKKMKFDPHKKIFLDAGFVVAAMRYRLALETCDLFMELRYKTVVKRLKKLANIDPNRVYVLTMRQCGQCLYKLSKPMPAGYAIIGGHFNNSLAYDTQSRILPTPYFLSQPSSAYKHLSSTKLSTRKKALAKVTAHSASCSNAAKAPSLFVVATESYTFDFPTLYDCYKENANVSIILNSLDYAAMQFANSYVAPYWSLVRDWAKSLIDGGEMTSHFYFQEGPRLVDYIEPYKKGLPPANMTYYLSPRTAKRGKHILTLTLDPNATSSMESVMLKFSPVSYDLGGFYNFIGRYFGAKPIIPLLALKPKDSMQFLSDPMPTRKRICGMPKLKNVAFHINADTKGASNMHGGQIFFTLARVSTHAFDAEYLGKAMVYRPVDAENPSKVEIDTVYFEPFCQEIPAQWSIALIVSAATKQISRGGSLKKRILYKTDIDLLDHSNGKPYQLLLPLTNHTPPSL